MKNVLSTLFIFAYVSRFTYLLKMINVVNKNELLTISEAFLMFCMLGFKKQTTIYFMVQSLCL